MEKRFYNAKEIAHYLGMSEDAVRKWAMRGQIPFIKFGKSLRFDMVKVERWVKSKECPYVQRQFT